MHKKGFTLIEVLIVIIIIGILASIALPQYISTIAKARSAEAVAQLGTFRASMERRFYDQLSEGSYTALASLGGLDVDVPLDANVDWDYTFTDSSTGITAKSYFFTATHDSNGNWVSINHDGVFRRSTSLGGSGTTF